MKYLLLSVSFFASFSNGMEPNSWTPWNCQATLVIEDYAAAQFLESVTDKYKKMYTQMRADNPKYTAEYVQGVNLKHTNQLKLIIARFGWPTELTFNKKCAEGALHVAQRSADVRFQNACLQKLAQLQTVLGKQQYAYLLDLIAVKQGKPQYFGTQVDRTGKLYPIQGYNPNPENLAETELQLEVINQRRLALGF